MSNIKALRQRRVELQNENQTILARGQAENRPMTEAEKKLYERNVETLESNYQMLLKTEVELNTERRGEPVEDSNELADRRAGAPGQNSHVSAIVRKGRTFAEMFGTPKPSEWKSSEEFFRAVHSGSFHPQLRAAATEGVPSAGGFLVPEDLSSAVLDKALESEIVRPRADIQPMTSETKKIAGLDVSDNSSGALFGGFTVQWSPELGTGTDKQPKVRLIQLSANKMVLYVPVSSELLEDGQSFETLLSDAMIKATAWNLDYAFLNGDGAGKPKGVLSDPALITVNKESGQVANTVLYENVVNMFARLHPACISNSIWIANSTTIPQLLLMKNVVKNVAGTENVGGSAVPIVSQNGDQMTMLTRPIIFTEKLPALSSKGDILLCDLSQYSVGIRREITLEKSIHAGWQSDSISYRSTVRVDGQGRWMKAFTPRNGNSLSWCVTLQAR